MGSAYSETAYRTLFWRSLRLVTSLAVLGLTGILLIIIWARNAANGTASPSEIAEDPLTLFFIAYGLIACIALIIGTTNRIGELKLIRRNRKIVSNR